MVNESWGKLGSDFIRATVSKVLGNQHAPVNYTSVDDLNPYTSSNDYQTSIFDGDKFFDGFGTTQLQHVDYWKLRARSSQLFNDNLYARGLIRRLITNEINTGLTPESFPDEQIIGVPDDSLQDWSDLVESRFHLYSKNPKVCDYYGRSTFGELQRQARREALISGDVLVVLSQSRRTGLPMIRLVSGNKVQSPLTSNEKPRLGNKIEHGVELDSNRRVVAHWVRQNDLTTKRIPAWGEKSGKRLSWLVYGTDKRLDDVRGQPLLSLILQSLKEIDRYRDAATRKAVINSILAMFIRKDQDKLGTLPITGNAVKKGEAIATDANGGTRSFNIAGQIPGLVFEELQHGETPEGFGSQGTDIDFGVFEQSIIQAVAWAQEVPPEILTLAFSNNYSASQAAINEFKIYLNKVWSEFGEDFCDPIQSEWLLSEVLLNKIQAPGLLEAWRNIKNYDVFGAWMNTEWYGSVKPSTDMLKQAKGSKLLIDEMWSTNTRESRELKGTKFSRNAKRVKRENQLKAEALRPLAEFNAEFGMQQNGNIETLSDMVIENINQDKEL